MIFGACYYPEHWEKSEWQGHARLMKEAGFNTVRMADFGWSLMEPEEDKFDFSLFDEAIEVLAKENIKVILCTHSSSS